jgi:hypothetical protein
MPYAPIVPALPVGSALDEVDAGRVDECYVA